MSATDYLIVLSQGNSFKPLQDKFNQLEGFYTGIGYAFPSKSEIELRQILSPLEAKILRQPLGEGQSFNSLRLSFKSAFFRQKLMEKEMELFRLRAQLGLDELTEESIEASNIQDYRKQEALEAIHECEKLKKAADWAEGMEKAVSITPKEPFGIKFINEREKNFLLEDAAPMPRLINFIDEGIPKAFIRKGVVGMVVGAGGVGKTHFLAQLGLSIVTGTPFLGKYPIEKPGCVFIGLGENSDEDVHRLLRKTFKSMFYVDPQMNIQQEQELETISRRLSVTSFTGMQASFIHRGFPTALFEMLLNALKTREPEEGWSCIILDPISRFLGAEAETDNAAATQFISLLERITLELKGNPTVLFGHHMNKSGVSGTNTDQAAARGSSALTDGVRFQINLEKSLKESANKADKTYEKDKITMRLVKSNFTAPIPDQVLQKDDYGVLKCVDNSAPYQKKIGPSGHNYN